MGRNLKDAKRGIAKSHQDEMEKRFRDSMEAWTKKDCESDFDSLLKYAQKKGYKDVKQYFENQYGDCKKRWGFYARDYIIRSSHTNNSSENAMLTFKVKVMERMQASLAGRGSTPAQAALPPRVEPEQSLRGGLAGLRGPERELR